MDTRKACLGEPCSGLPSPDRLLPVLIALAALAGAAAWAVNRVLTNLSARSQPAREESFLFHGQPQPAPVTPSIHPGPKMPDFTVHTMEGETTTVFGPDHVAPPIMTVFLAYCSDCAPSAAYFPKLAAVVRESGDEPVVNLAYMGQPGTVKSYLADKDFGGPTYLDSDGAVTRQLGIGTFTVYLLDRDGTIRFQGSPQAAECRLVAHLKARRESMEPEAPATK